VASFGSKSVYPGFVAGAKMTNEVHTVLRDEVRSSAYKEYCNHCPSVPIIRLPALDTLQFRVFDLAHRYGRPSQRTSVALAVRDRLAGEFR